MATQHGQIIVFDNIDPPSTVSFFAEPVLFTRNPDEGRYGFFPIEPMSRTLQFAFDCLRSRRSVVRGKRKSMGWG